MADDQLQRFVMAQERHYTTAFEEIKNGRKRSHWMWYIFPQLAGLGFSETSRYYAIRDREEADAYLRHPALGPRLVEISHELLRLATDDATAVFGSPDDLKLRSCMTLFSVVPDADPVFQAILDKYFEGIPDGKTLGILSPE
ncbi:hypothetical protein GCM10007415_22120 [Parapedobacter pyrenivorans]|uniref:Calpastatin n=1 Tax=Parapedobacter pyrenivorans TaxID=1305674 RepID=A0A917HR81_9SPHI|nr:DUF1810 domain-containing protein [Parapedobacter pyrenivorans]GGG87793.1 hypothetical protein GCM10007415_22120 [Parapedobacter pyrenivorans]